MKNKYRKRINLERGINVVLYRKTKKDTCKFEVYKKRTFKDFNHAQRFYKFMLTNVTDKIYMYQTNGRSVVEFRTYVPTFLEAYELRGIIEGYFELWKRDNYA